MEPMLDSPICFSKEYPNKKYIIIYENNDIEVKSENHRIIETIDQFFTEFDIAVELEDILLFIQNNLKHRKEIVSKIVSIFKNIDIQSELDLGDSSA